MSWLRFLLFLLPVIPLQAQEGVWTVRCAQIVAVVTPDWASPTGTLMCFEKKGGAWVAGESFSVTVGHRGLGLGVGLHPENLEGPRKEEGDKRAPAGVFSLESGFGTKSLKLPNFPYRRTTETDYWVDDPSSSHYNQWVSLDDPAIRQDWKSAEILRRQDGIYDLAIVVGHNRSPIVKGRGSAIFMHAWYGPGRSTIGCTAMEKGRVRELLEWLDVEKAPVLVQGPRVLLPRLDLPGEVLAVLTAIR